jgi:hypothetical protein
MRILLFGLLLSFFNYAHTSTHAQVSPTWATGEVKITYPCSVIDSLPKDKEEKEIISFFELGKNEVLKTGYIVRRRVETKSGKADFTIKYRSPSRSLVLENNLYAKLGDSSHGKLKCEFDANYRTDGHNISYSCSFKSETSLPLQEHYDFIKMVGKPISKLPPDISGMKEIKFTSTSWKLELNKAQKKENPFYKKPSIEMWTLEDGRCRMEISGRTDLASISKAISFIRSLVNSPPASDQGSKTEWVLQGR